MSAQTKKEDKMMYKGILTAASVVLLAGAVNAATDEIYDWRMKEGMAKQSEAARSGSNLALYETQNDEIYGDDVMDGAAKSAYNICQKRIIKQSHNAWRD
jgi:hypothetical protein